MCDDPVLGIDNVGGAVLTDTHRPDHTPDRVDADLDDYDAVFAARTCERQRHERLRLAA